MTFREFTGKSVEEAVRAAMAEFHADLGDLVIRDDEAVSGQTAEVASDLLLDLPTLMELARTDGAFRNLSNAWINWDPATGNWAMLEPMFEWFGEIGEVARGTADAQTLQFGGYVLQVSTNDPRVDAAALCSGASTLALVPPSARTRSTWGTRSARPAAPGREGGPRHIGTSTCRS